MLFALYWFTNEGVFVLSILSMQGFTVSNITSYCKSKLKVGYNVH